MSKPVSPVWETSQDPPYTYLPDYLNPAEAEHYFKLLLQQVPWQQGQVCLFGKTINEPRLTAWYGDPGADYVYSGKSNHALPWTPELLELKARVEHLCAKPFNSVLLNLYRDGQDSMGAHQDNEPELGPAPWIASVSLGAARKLVFKKLQANGKHELYLAPGSLLLMQPALQAEWKHGLPKSRQVQTARINLTFRHIFIDIKHDPGSNNYK